jgi:hypothetical protein
VFWLWIFLDEWVYTLRRKPRKKRANIIMLGNRICRWRRQQCCRLLLVEHQSPTVVHGGVKTKCGQNFGASKALYGLLALAGRTADPLWLWDCRMHTTLLNFSIMRPAPTLPGQPIRQSCEYLTTRHDHL